MKQLTHIEINQINKHIREYLLNNASANQLDQFDKMMNLWLSNKRPFMPEGIVPYFHEDLRKFLLANVSAKLLEEYDQTITPYLPPPPTTSDYNNPIFNFCVLIFVTIIIGWILIKVLN